MIAVQKNKIVDFLKSPIGLVLLIGLVLRLFLFFMFQPYNHLDELIVSDAEGYYRIAVNIIKTGTFVIPNSHLDTIRTPIYPLFLAVIYGIFGINVSVSIIIQQLISLASVFFLYRIAKILFDKRIALISSILFCLEPDHIYFSFELMTDTLFVFFILLSTLFLVRFFKENKNSSIIYSALFAGIATLTRPISLLIPFVVIFIVIIYVIKEKKHWLFILQKSVLFLFIFVITLSPWLVRNKILYNTFSITSISGYNLLDFNVAFTIKRNSDKSIDLIRRELYSDCLLHGDSLEIVNNDFYFSKIKTEVALNYIKNNKNDYLKANIIGLFNLYSSMGYKDYIHRFFNDSVKLKTKCRYNEVYASWDRVKNMGLLYIVTAIINLIYLVFLYILSLTGAFALFEKHEYAKAVSILSIILYFTILTGIVAINRYKLPISPYYILLASVGISYLVQKYKSNRLKNDKIS